MNDQDMQAQFIQWLAQKTGAKTEEELKQVVERLQADEPTMQKVMAQFQAEVGGGQTAAPQFGAGGKLDYLECLKQMKKGGKMNCGCRKKVHKGLLGMVAKGVSLAPKIAGLAKSAPKALSLGQKVLKFGMDNKKAILGTVQGGMDLAKSAKGLKNTDSSVITPSAGNDYYGANAGAIQSPQMLSMQRQVPIFTGSNIPDGGIVNNTLTPPTQPKLIEKGGKLKKKKLANGGILFADKGAKIAKRETRIENRREKRDDNRAERIHRRADRKLVNEYNYQGTETSSGVFERDRNRFDEGAEAFMNARQPRGITDNSDPGRNKNMEMDTWNTWNRPTMGKTTYMWDAKAPGNPASETPVATRETTPEFKTRGEAFKAARAQLLADNKDQNSGTFTFGGKSYNTKMAGAAPGVMAPSSAVIPASNRVPVYIGNNPGLLPAPVASPFNPLNIGGGSFIPKEASSAPSRNIKPAKVSEEEAARVARMETINKIGSGIKGALSNIGGTLAGYGSRSTIGPNK